jgi:hypothetical protein
VTAAASLSVSALLSERASESWLASALVSELASASESWSPLASALASAEPAVLAWVSELGKPKEADPESGSRCPSVL